MIPREDFAVVNADGIELFGFQAETCVLFNIGRDERIYPHRLHNDENYQRAIPILRDSPNAVIRARICQATPWYVSGGGGSA